MATQKREAPGANRGHNHSLAANGGRNSTISIIRSKQCWNVTRHGNRIASFLHEAKAVAFAEAVRP